MTWVVTFERIGRVHNPAPIEIEGELDDELADRIAEAVHRKAGRFLLSRDFEVGVWIDPDQRAGTCLIEFGRSGRGYITEKREDEQ